MDVCEMDGCINVPCCVAKYLDSSHTGEASGPGAWYYRRVCTEHSKSPEIYSVKDLPELVESERRRLKVVSAARRQVLQDAIFPGSEDWAIPHTDPTASPYNGL